MNLFTQYKPLTLLLSIAPVLSLVAGGFLVASRAQAPQDPEDVIRTETDLTNVLLTATDKQNRMITTLREEDLRVLEDGVPQKLFTFNGKQIARFHCFADRCRAPQKSARSPMKKAAARSFIERLFGRARIRRQSYRSQTMPISNKG